MSTKQRVFIGSSDERRGLAERLSKILRSMHEKQLSLLLWDNPQNWRPGETIVDCLLATAEEVDFAVLLCAGDDELFIRGQAQMAVRDNLWFEAGLFINHLGRHRVFVVADSGKNLQTRIPTDYSGIIYVPCDYSLAGRKMTSQLAKIASEIAKQIGDTSGKSSREKRVLATLITSRDECYDKGIKLIQHAKEVCYSIISYDDELRLNGGKAPHETTGTLQYKLFRALLKRSKEHNNRLTIRRYMNLGQPPIVKQALDIISHNKSSKKGNPITIEDTYCKVIEAIVTENQVLIVIPGTEGTLDRVGIGVLLESRNAAEQFTQWITQKVPAPSKEEFVDNAAQLKKYLKTIFRHDGPRLHVCTGCQVSKEYKIRRQRKIKRDLEVLGITL
ncbi:MAG TPA: TIR domain-containing protein [Candidatus Deferrimicrobium sp.]|nr:TIR domain-containing protein [Candidatus Deferrimicrobium sp.]